MPSVVPRLPSGFTTLPDESTYVLANCSVPAACLNSSTEQHTDDPDRLVGCDILVSNGIICEIGSLSDRGDAHPKTDLEGGLCFPAFVDLHTHIGAGQTTIRNLLFLGLCFVDQIRPDSSTEPKRLSTADKGHTCERSRNPTGSLTGADRSTAQDASFWNLGDVFWCGPYGVSAWCVSMKDSVVRGASTVQ